MKRTRQRSMNLLVCVLLLISAWASGQVTQTDYDRASKLRERFQRLAINVPERAYAIADTNRFWYRKFVKGGNEFVVVDPETMTKKPAFDHAALAASLSSAAGRTYTALTLPFSTFTFVQKETAIEFTAAGTNWRCELVSGYSCSKAAITRPGGGQTEPPGTQMEESPEDNPREYDNDVFDTTSHGSVFSEPRQADRMLLAHCSFIPSFIRLRFRTPAVTTTAWTRSGETNIG